MSQAYYTVLYYARTYFDYYYIDYLEKSSSIFQHEKSPHCLSHLPSNYVVLELTFCFVVGFSVPMNGCLTIR